MLFTVTVQIQKCWVAQRNTIKTIIPRFYEHFVCLSANSLFRDLRYNEPISPVPWHFVKSRFHCRWFQLTFRVVKAMQTAANLAPSAKAFRHSAMTRGDQVQSTALSQAIRCHIQALSVQINPFTSEGSSGVRQ